MSSEAESKPPPQASTDDPRQEFYRLACIVLRLIIVAVSESCARQWGRRIEAWGRAVVVPESGYGNLAAVQAVLDMSEIGAERFVKRNQIPSNKPGKQHLYRLADLASKSDPEEAN